MVRRMLAALASASSFAPRAFEEAERVKPLEAKSLWISIGVIVAIGAVIVLAGFGYFSFTGGVSGDGAEGHGDGGGAGRRGRWASSSARAAWSGMRVTPASS